MEEAIILPARIVRYYPETQTADVKISAEKVYNSLDTKENIRSWQEIKEVPIQTFCGGDFVITFPIQPGDTCKMCFSQVGYDHWFYKDKDTAGMLYEMPHPHLRRKFSISDGFCEVGYNTLPRTFKNVSPTDSVWRNRNLTSYITIKEDGSVEIQKDGTKIAIEVDNSISVVAPTVNITAPTMNLNGDITHTGEMNHIGKLTRSGANSSYHTFHPVETQTIDSNTVPELPQQP